jgi:hypothetical protein
MGDSFGDMSTAGPTEIAKVTATMGLNITYMFVLLIVLTQPVPSQVEYLDF